MERQTSLVGPIIVFVPFWVDVDHYRPQLVDLANQQIQGKLELGKLRLSLWGQIRIEVAGLKLTTPTGDEVVHVEDAYFHVPFLFLSGSPILTFKMNQPTIQLSRIVLASSML